jgi:hypothetical protein
VIYEISIGAMVIDLIRNCRFIEIERYDAGIQFCG